MSLVSGSPSEDDLTSSSQTSSIQESSKTTFNRSSSNKNNTVKTKHRRRRVYDRLRGNEGYTQQLETVFEGEELRHKRTWFGPKIACILATVIVCIAGIKEGYELIRDLKNKELRGSMIQLEEGKDAILLGGKKDKNNENIVSVNINNENNNEAVGIEDEKDDELYHSLNIPEKLRYLADIDEPPVPTDRALFWHIPRSGGTAIELIALQCLRLVVASDLGASAVSGRIEIINDLEGKKYLNVDTSSRKGIQHAMKSGITNFPELEIVKSPLFYDAAENLFSNDHQGRCFALLRHPIERVVSLFYDRKNALNLPVPIEKYADRLDSNWMTRMLSNASEGERLTAQHLATAKNVLEEKCLVGLLDEINASVKRFEAYFQWTLNDRKAKKCHSKLLDLNWPRKNRHTVEKEGSHVWRILAEANDFDMKLYQHAIKVYERQGIKLFGKSRWKK